MHHGPVGGSAISNFLEGSALSNDLHFDVIFDVSHNAHVAIEC